MKKLVTISLVLFFAFISSTVMAQEKKTRKEQKVDRRIDNMGYWKRMAKKGYVDVAPEVKTKQATIKGSHINAKSVNADDSTDVPVSATGSDTQSEVSIFVNPTDNSKALNSNNSTDWNGSSVGTLYGTSFLSTDDFGTTWGGSIQGAGGSNSGDPAAVIGLDGRQYIGFIHNNSGQGVSYSTDGVNWTSVVAGTTTGSMLDKNHLWIDNSPTSPYEGNVYDAWTDFGGSMNNNIGFVHSTDGGLTYSTPINISAAVGSGSHDQGVNIQTGPNGEVYVTWAIYDGWPTPETALGFAKSTDGGVSFAPATRIISNINGIRDLGVSKNHRVNSFPSMATDISGGDNNGNIYIVWSNIGTPGVNTGTNRSVYMIKSTDGGSSWGTPIKVNQGAFLDGKEAYFSWITCDPVTGVLSVIFYDDRDVSSTEVETWVANSYDAGDTWEDFRVSDVAFTPQPIAGLATGYMGDYLGISARDGMVYPAWPDNRNGYVQTFVSPFETNTRIRPTDLMIALNEATGQTDLSWSFEGATTFQHFIVYRDGTQLGTTTDMSYTDMLPDYGVYSYSVTAMHSDGESSGANGTIQWGNPDISVTPESLVETLAPNQTSTQIVTVTNNGELELTYDLSSMVIPNSPQDPQAYCEASGGGGDEHITGVVFGDINNTGTPQSNYADYTALSTDVDAGNTYSITITNGEVWAQDDLGIWIDLNQDEDFDDEGENVLCEIDMGGQGTFDITIPPTTVGGQTRMRIRIKYGGSDCGSSCGTTSWGEVEDYTLNINSWLHVGDSTGILAPGASETINVDFDSTDLALGDYFATLSLNSNDTDTPLVEVPITLHVTDDSSLAATATADAYEVCEGSSTTLHANAVGGEGNYTYVWTSVPNGFDSTDANPSISPTEDTEYIVIVSDGASTVTSSVSLTIQTVPAQAEMPNGETVLCQDAENSTYTSTSVEGADSYVWTITPASAGVISSTSLSAVVNWNVDFSGVASISLIAVNECGEGDTSNVLEVSVNELPVVTFEASEVVCVNADLFVLTGGSPEGGTYSGTGVTGGNFDPTTAGVGTHTITYSYTNSNNCEGFATSTIVVNPLPTVSLDAFEDVADNVAAFELTGGTPEGGVYSGDGVDGGMFDPSSVGQGVYTITYTYTASDTGCMNSAEQTIEVFHVVSVDDFANGISFNLYPNPNNGLLFLDINSRQSKNLKMLLVNQVGAIVNMQNIVVEDKYHSSIDLSQYASGVYYVRIEGENINFTRKIIIQK